MKKNNLVILFFICITLLVTACSDSIEETPEAKWEGLKETWDGKVMVDGEIYVYTAYEIPVEIEKEFIIGEIDSFVGNYEKPSKDSQANFDIKGSKYAKYEDDIVVLIDKEWILFMNQDDWSKGISIGNSGVLIENLGDDEAFKLLSRISLGVKKDKDYENNLDTIIEDSFSDCGIEDFLLMEEAKSNLKITVSDSK